MKWKYCSWCHKARERFKWKYRSWCHKARERIKWKYCSWCHKARERFKWKLGAGIAQWLERRTRDWKVAGSNPCWNGGRIFFSRVDFLCWLLFRYPFHPRVTTVARKKSRSFCQKCRWPYVCGFYWTVLRHWSQLVPNMSNDIWGH